MARQPSLDEARRWFAEDLRVIGHLRDERVVDAFATVPRERFAGPGPWRILHLADGYWTTPDDDPRRLYHNVLVALDEERAAQYRRAVSVGAPFRPASACGRRPRAADRRRLRLLHGHPGRAGGADAATSTASRSTRALAAAAAAQSRGLADGAVRRADASLPIDGQWDVIVAFAGATAPHAWWLDALADGGRLLLPMTTEPERGGFMLRLDRHGGGFAARSAGWVGFYPCAGARSRRGEAALGQALDDPAGQQAVRSLRRDPHDEDESLLAASATAGAFSKHELH